ncbi:hypothetical protein E1301_Tti021132 [Triplophysa tibetana]|uniref:Uncharacterized protein n=1 Tax=Triplophysa tibetana TaxID=1572043 RepID=A0A5A9PHN6_9TELE|nr:hypothetical protein E1301_Tti021132 [Triplophysa tibetana]
MAEGHTAKLDVDEIVKQGQTIIQILDNESSRNHLNLVLKESIELLGKTHFVYVFVGGTETVYSVLVKMNRQRKEGSSPAVKSDVNQDRSHVHNKQSLLLQTTQQNLKKETESLQDMKKELSVDDGILYQWVTDVQEWAHTTSVGNNDAAIQPIRNTIEELSLCIKQRQHRLYRHTATNKGRNKIRRKMNEERKKLSSSIEQHNALVDPSFKVVSIEEVLQNDFVFPWQLTEQDDVNLLTKKKVYDKVMLIQRLEEEQTVLVQEAKQHWLYLRSQEHKLNSLLDTIISGVNPWNLPDDGIQGLQCVLKRKLHELRAHQDTVKTSYQAIDTITEHITVEECEYPNWLEPSEVLYSSSNDLSSDEDDAFLL